MDITRYETSTRMSQAVVHDGVVYLAGQVAEGSSVTEQTKGILGKIDGLLANAGSSRSRMLSATIWLTNMDDFAEMNAVWDAWVDSANAPARACVESARLATPEYHVEIMVTVAQAES